MMLGLIAVGLLIWRGGCQIGHNSFGSACSMKMHCSFRLCRHGTGDKWQGRSCSTGPGQLCKSVHEALLAWLIGVAEEGACRPDSENGAEKQDGKPALPRKTCAQECAAA